MKEVKSRNWKTISESQYPWEREALTFTGLRWNELRSITIGAAHLDTEPAFLLLEAANEKKQEGRANSVTGRFKKRLDRISG